MAGVWRCGRHALGWGAPLVMGILNVTPDSFSDGGRYAEPLAALEHGRALIAAGADIIDVGGESTRPGSDEVSESEELARVRPIVAALARDFPVPVSVDTRHAAVAEACLAAGASIINDVAGFRDAAMVAVAADSDAGVVVMHMRGEPKTMQDEPAYDDVTAEVTRFLLDRAAALEAVGVSRDRIALDPGLGFGKTTAHNLELLRRLPELAAHGYPVLVGASRKRFLGEVTGEAEPARRIGASVGVALWAAQRGAAILRVHDVAETAQAFGMWAALDRTDD